MIIVETPIVTKRIRQFLSDEEYRFLQNLLIIKPDLGKLIPGSGGLRKIRWGYKGQGKRGGLRIIYYWVASEDRILMLFIYPKQEQEDLTIEQLKVLKRIIKEEYP